LRKKTEVKRRVSWRLAKAHWGCSAKEKKISLLVNSYELLQVVPAAFLVSSNFRLSSISNFNDACFRAERGNILMSRESVMLSAYVFSV
jgi:hypothetical protein